MQRWHGTHAFDRIRLADDKRIAFGDAQDVYMAWDGTNLTVVMSSLAALAMTDAKFNITSTSISAASPSRQAYWQFTATGTLTGGMTGLEIRSTFNGAASYAGGGIVGAEIKARHTTGNAYTIGQLRGVVGNVDTKNGTTTTAYALEGSIDVSAGGTITAAAGLHVNLNNSGTVTTSYGAFLEGIAGYTLTYGIYIQHANTGIYFNGAYTGNVIDFTSVTINHTGSNGPCMIRAGTYASPVTNADEDQSGMVRLYGATTADGTSYDRGVFVCLQTTGTKGIFPVAGLAEIKAQTGAGPTKAQAAQFIVMLQDVTSVLASLGGDSTAGMYAAWLKVGGVSGSVASAGSRVAAVWLDNQLNGTVSGEEYAAFITCGGSKVDAVFGFETTSSGWKNFLYFDETAYDQDPVVASGCNVSGAGASEAYLRISLNGTVYGIPLIAI
uniref:Uncharacterized protein n=1 Tax=viral metagenome TaxID=1070528 RepID=A0A6M3J898_9ZZZZ